MHASNDKLISKTGEISIIRANQNKVKQEHDNRLVELQRQHAREIEKQKIELEQAKKEKERIATHNKFLDHEINGHNLQQKQKAGKGKRTTVPLNSTPKKNKGALLRDGFDDNEIMIVSPTKSPHKSKVNTPKAGAKRKRDALGDSPAQPLPISQDFNDFLPDAPEPFIADTRVPPGIHSADASKEKSRFDVCIPSQLERRRQSLTAYSFYKDFLTIGWNQVE